MTKCNRRSILFMCPAGSGAGLSACQSYKHTMVEPKGGTVIVCTECYNEVYKLQHPAGSPWGATRTKNHMCPSCTTAMSIYTEGGVSKRSFPRGGGHVQPTISGMSSPCRAM